MDDVIKLVEPESQPVSNATRGPDLVIEGNRFQLVVQPDKVILVLVEGEVTIELDAQNAAHLALEIGQAAHEAYARALPERLARHAAGNAETTPDE